MSGQRGVLTKSFTGEPYSIEKERLDGSDTELTSFYFHQGANVYVFSYTKGGSRRHTFIDAGDARYRSQLLPILMENDVNPSHIERIILTHRHPDHCGLAALLAKGAGAKVVVHANFRTFIEGEVKPEEQRWLGNFAPTQLKECDVEYLSQPGSREVRDISGVDFPSLIEPIEIGESGSLMILACPESTATHSPDQIIVLYSPQSYPRTHKREGDGLRPTDDILFSGDLWLMKGPFHHGGMRHVPRHGFRQMKNLVSGQSMPRRDPREQDSRAKEALKKGFSLIRVKPGHGEEFIGSRIIPRSVLANRDLLLALGYPLGASVAILRQKDLSPRVAALREQAYTSFIQEVLYWAELGYTSDEISALLARIYKEQSGGGALAAEDRRQRRARLKAILARLKDDKAESEELHQLAQATLAELERVL